MQNPLTELDTSLLDAMPIGVLWLNPEGEVVFANKQTRLLLGIQKEDIIGQSSGDSNWRIVDLKGNPVTNLDALFKSFVERGKSLSGLRYAIERPDRQHVYVSSEITPVFDSDVLKGVVCTLESLQDTGKVESDRARLQEAVKRAQEVESIGRLAGHVAHNLNNILSPVIGYSDMALEILGSHDPLHDHLKDIRSATERATRLVRQLLAFARKQAFELRPLDLGQVVADLEPILRQSIREDIELDLSMCLPVEYVMADLSQVQQIVIALLLNAGEAIEKSGRISVSTENVVVDSSNSSAHPDIETGAYAILTVTDSGRGMDQEMLGQVFEPFFTTKEVGQGSGLGLSTVYGTVKQHGGSIRVNSERGVGSAFKVYFPKPSRKAFTPPVTRDMSLIKPNHETILVVEDEESLLKFTSLVLKKVGYKVLEASCGEEALKIAKGTSDKIHLLLTDVIMPGMNGKEIYETLSKTRPSTKILYTSGYPDDVIARHGIVNKEENLLQKPTTVDKLTNKVRQVLDA